MVKRDGRPRKARLIFPTRPHAYDESPAPSKVIAGRPNDPPWQDATQSRHLLWMLEGLQSSQKGAFLPPFSGRNRRALQLSLRLAVVGSADLLDDTPHARAIADDQMFESLGTAWSRHQTLDGIRDHEPGRAQPGVYQLAHEGVAKPRAKGWVRAAPDSAHRDRHAGQRAAALAEYVACLVVAGFAGCGEADGAAVPGERP